MLEHIGFVFLLLFLLMIVFDLINKRMRDGGTYFRWAVVLFLIVNSGLLAKLLA